jgi:hypothetical protein
LAEYAIWKVKWSNTKKAWCCTHKNRGCNTAPERYDCQAAYSNWQAAWSEGKKKWCCSRQGRACPAGFTSDPYDCVAGFSNWRSGWSPGKTAWCCRVKGLACGGSTNSVAPGRPVTSTSAWHPFNCEQDFSVWRTRWTHPKRQWCCNNYGRACEGTTSEPFDCTAGFTNWQVGWSPQKRHWCCHSYNRGCTDIVNRYELLPQQMQGLANHMGWGVLTGAFLVSLVAFAGAAATSRTIWCRRSTSRTIWCRRSQREDYGFLSENLDTETPSHI